MTDSNYAVLARGIRLSRFAVSPVEFAQEGLGIKLAPKQAEFLKSRALRQILCCCRGWGKTYVAAVAVVHQAVFYPKSDALVLSASQRQAQLLIRHVKDFLMVLAETAEPIETDTNNVFSIVFANGSRIDAVPDSDRTIRGFHVDLLIEDEAAQVKDRTHQALRPMVVRKNGRYVMMSTPFGKRGHFYEEWENRDPSATWQRIFAPISVSDHVPPETIEEFRKSPAFGVLAWASEYECQFVQTDSNVFAAEDWSRAANPRIQRITEGSLFDE